MAKLPGKTQPAPVTADAAATGQVITAGVDTHRDFHWAAVKNTLGQVLGTRRFAATGAGYQALLAWLRGFGTVTAVGVEGTGSYGAGLTRYLTGEHVRVVEVNRPNRQKRRRQGKTDPLDAISAAAATQSGDATAAPKLRTGPIESVRVLRGTRDTWIKARTAAWNTLRALLVTAPDDLREQLTGLTPARLLAACLALPGTDNTGTGLAHALLDAGTATRIALHDLATMISHYDQAVTRLNTQLTALITLIAPRTLAQHGLGPDTTGQLLITAGNNPDRLRSEPAFAMLTGTAPHQASSGLTDRHRLNRGGDRHANAALYRITITRMATHQPTRDYVTTHRTPNRSNGKHIIRKLKRYIARNIYPHLTADLAALQHLTP
ncbi:IS110 family transposase [Amycolatopsis sp. NBC_01480]|uniref:IS110 family transposase n=1 Tax=Amycolatopsis sp. NBC_01480 TaxID=2903562 RepID=UPI002E2A12D1|nr:IS110 family transposase [Amycolatopsis sp. NBC_01480]